jgi:hypothetical protein
MSRTDAEEMAIGAAVEVLRHNARGGADSLPRTAGWGYPEPYTRDLMIAAPGILLSGDAELITSLRRVLETLAHNQSPLGQVPGLVNDPRDRGSSDTTPLFLIGLALYREHTGETVFLEEAAGRALGWLAYQSPDDRVIVAQQPTSDWRDEQWVLGYGLYVNTLVYAALRLFGQDEKAAVLRERINRPVIVDGTKPAHLLEGLALPDRPYYALWSYKVHYSARADLLGNCLAIIFGVADPDKARAILDWVEQICAALRVDGSLALDVPPCLMLTIERRDPDWHPRYEQFNRPGDYHNGGVWPFIAGWYVAAQIAAGRDARDSLNALVELTRPARRTGLAFGFNEWFSATDGLPRGEDWQTWSAAMLIYAAECVRQKSTPFFDEMRIIL